MSIPYAFALGLIVLLLVRDWFVLLPGAGDVWTAAAYAPLLAVPALLAGLAVGRLRPGRAFGRGRKWLERLAHGSLPVVYGLLLGPGSWLDLIDRWSRGSYVAFIALALLPLLAAEVARIVVDARGTARLDAANLAAGPAVRHRLAFVALVVAPWLLLAIAGDALSGHRHLEALVAGSTAGITLAAILFVLLLGIVMPLAFRFLFGLSRRLPEPLGAELRATAAALGFPGRSVLWFDSGMRTVNALMLGPLPWPRYLVMTDGLVAVLQVPELRGVVAHEIGHAQAGHPAILLVVFVIVPLLLVGSVQHVDPAMIESPWLLVAVAIGALLTWRLLRRIAHRFEHEADVLSAIALGGAEPCIRALQRVGSVVQQDPERPSMLHPSENDRIRLLRAVAGDPAYRARFALQGLRLRRVIGALLLVALAIGAWSWYQAWPVERAAMHYHVGDLAAARAQAATIGADVPADRWQWWQSFREELDAASLIAGDGGEWEAIRTQLVEGGWQRGVRALVQDGAPAARPWFALAAQGEDVSSLRRCLLLYCEAARDNDATRMLAIAAHIRRLGFPSELAAVFGS